MRLSKTLEHICGIKRSPPLQLPKAPGEVLALTSAQPKCERSRSSRVLHPSQRWNHWGQARDKDGCAVGSLRPQAVICQGASDGSRPESE